MSVSVVQYQHEVSVSIPYHLSLLTIYLSFCSACFHFFNVSQFDQRNKIETGMELGHYININTCTSSSPSSVPCRSSQAAEQPTAVINLAINTTCSEWIMKREGKRTRTKATNVSSYYFISFASTQYNSRSPCGLLPLAPLYWLVVSTAHSRYLSGPKLTGTETDAGT